MAGCSRRARRRRRSRRARWTSGGSWGRRAQRGWRRCWRRRRHRRSRRWTSGAFPPPAPAPPPLHLSRFALAPKLASGCSLRRRNGLAADTPPPHPSSCFTASSRALGSGRGSRRRRLACDCCPASRPPPHRAPKRRYAVSAGRCACHGRSIGHAKSRPASLRLPSPPSAPLAPLLRVSRMLACRRPAGSNRVVSGGGGACLGARVCCAWGTLGRSSVACESDSGQPPSGEDRLGRTGLEYP
jgi:hypothetical protein